MELQALRLLVTEQDFDQSLPRLLAENSQVKKVKVRLAPDGVRVTGVYHMVFDVPFEARWELAVRDGKLAVRLAAFEVVGMGGAVLKPVLLSAIGEAVKNEEAIRLEEETILVDLDGWLAKRGLPLRTNLSAVRTEAGRLLIEASTSSPLI